jgi:hypothetical protein
MTLCIVDGGGDGLAVFGLGGAEVGEQGGDQGANFSGEAVRGNVRNGGDAAFDEIAEDALTLGSAHGSAAAKGVADE